MAKFVFRVEQTHESVWIAPGAVVVGDVHLAQDVSVWFNAVIRGDTETLHIGSGTNIQDLCMLHADPGFPVRIGKGVTVGHRAIVHGATVGDHSLIGMGAILLNGAVVGARSIVGAGALLTQGKVYPPDSLIIGSPAIVKRELTDDERMMIEASALHYIEKAKQYRDG